MLTFIRKQEKNRFSAVCLQIRHESSAIFLGVALQRKRSLINLRINQGELLPAGKYFENSPIFLLLEHFFSNMATNCTKYTPSTP
jgi:hypothetical protein